MRKRHLFWIASWLAVTTSACTTLRPSKPDIANACAEWRWIGISKPGMQCPEIPGWKVRPLFPQLSPIRRESGDYCGKPDDSERVPDPELIRELNRFCVYETGHWKQWLGHHPSPPASAGLVRVDQDCAAVMLSGGEKPAAQTLDEYSKSFSDQAGTKPFTIKHPYGVRLSFLDTEPTGVEVLSRRGRSAHGHTLASLAKGLVCQGGSCAARVTTRLALPILSFNPKHQHASKIDLKNGGFLGLQSHLAEAIRGEVDDWRAGPERHLVLNLSLAWDGNLFGGLDEESIEDMRAGTQAVYRALQYAAGFDVLVLAAAGNQKRSPCESFGPLMPAGWETARRENACGRSRPAPLIYGVGGVRSDGRLLINAREGGMPRRAAYGENAPVPSPYRNGPLAVLTGSSVATAVVSAIAADVWSAFPERTSQEIMEVLDGSGDALPLAAGFWFDANVSSLMPAQAPGVRRLSLCSAMEAAWKKWESPLGSCPVELPCAAWVKVPSPDPEDWVPDSCQPWVHSQPETPVCMVCGPPD